MKAVENAGLIHLVEIRLTVIRGLSRLIQTEDRVDVCQFKGLQIQKQVDSLLDDIKTLVEEGAVR